MALPVSRNPLIPFTKRHVKEVKPVYQGGETAGEKRIQFSVLFAKLGVAIHLLGHTADLTTCFTCCTCFILSK